MNPLNPTPRFAAVSSAFAALASAAGAVIQLTHDQSGVSTVEGFVEHLGLALFSAMLLSVIAPTAFIARRATGDVRPAIFTAVAAVALASLATISNVRGDDPSFFPVVAAPSVLTIFGSWIVIAVRGFRLERMPKALMVGLPLIIVVSLPLSQLGGGLLAAAYWLAIALYAVRGSARSAGAPVAATA